MKTIEQLLLKQPYIIGEFTNAQDVFEQFCVDSEISKNINIIFASYQYESYEGYAYVLYEMGGSLYETFGSHCSCYGLEGQFDMNLVTIDELEGTLSNVNYSGYYGNEQILREILGIKLKN